MSVSRQGTEDRLAFLDGLRGVAILSVVIYHAYVRWSTVLPEKMGTPWRDLLDFGKSGVWLFFVISGFVILMTLERCDSLVRFLKRRWLRLFPAMFIVTILIVATAKVFPERPLGLPKPGDVVPGLSLISPEIWQRLGFGFSSLEGTFWSLYVEVFFYIIIGVSYFLFNRRQTVSVILCLGALGLFLSYGLALFPSLKPLTALSELLGLQYYGYFGAGALFYRYWVEKTPIYLASAIGVWGALTVTGEDVIHGVFLLSLFALGIGSPHVRTWLGSWPLRFLGYVSYSLYLVHEGTMVSLIKKTYVIVPDISPVLAPVLPIFVVILIAYLVTRLEEAVRAKTVKATGHLSRVPGL